MSERNTINEVYIELIACNENTRNPLVICKQAKLDLDVDLSVTEVVLYLKERGLIEPRKYNLTMKEVFNNE